MLAGCFSPGADPSAAAGDEPAPPRLAILDTVRSGFTQVLCPEGLCVRRLTTAATGPANEVMLAVDASDPTHWIAAAKDYHADNPTCVVVSVYASTDDGRAWTDGYPRPATGLLGGPGADRCESDPVVTFDGLGHAFVLTLDTGDVGLYTYRTGDLGRTWEEMSLAFKGSNDKNWVATDYRTHRVYSITRATCQRGEAVTYTDDAGLTWQGPFCFHGMDFAQIDVGPNGTVYAMGTTNDHVMFSKSVDGGRTWSPAQALAPLRAFSAAIPIVDGHLYRTPIDVDMAVSLGTGALYAVWHDTTDNQQEVYFVASFDDGETWSVPVVVNDDGGALAADQFIPAVAASPAGDAHVAFFDARNDPTGRGHVLDLYYAHSADGVRFDPNLRLTPSSFAPYLSRHQTQPFFVGDYIGLAATNAQAIAAFPATYNHRAEIHAVAVGG